MLQDKQRKCNQNIAFVHDRVCLREKYSLFIHVRFIANIFRVFQIYLFPLTAVRSLRWVPLYAKNHFTDFNICQHLNWTWYWIRWNSLWIVEAFETIVSSPKIKCIRILCPFIGRKVQTRYDIWIGALCTLKTEKRVTKLTKTHYEGWYAFVVAVNGNMYVTWNYGKIDRTFSVAQRVYDYSLCGVWICACVCVCVFLYDCLTSTFNQEITNCDEIFFSIPNWQKFA